MGFLAQNAKKGENVIGGQKNGENIGKLHKKRVSTPLSKKYPGDKGFSHFAKKTRASFLAPRGPPAAPKQAH